MLTDNKVAALLKEAGATVSVAESCTGGQIAHLFTMVSGSSEYFLGSVTSYAVKIKENVLGVPHETIETYGVVSSEVAAAMAEGVRKLTGSTFAISTTGLAEGGDWKYPEGTVWIGLSTPEGTFTKMYQCNLGRKGNIRRFSTEAVKMLFIYLSRNATSRKI